MPHQHGQEASEVKGQMLALWLALRTLRSRFGALLLTVCAVALATATALVVPLVTRQVERGAQDAAQVFDLLITARGSSTQAVMSTLFYLDAPIGNIPHQTYEDLKNSPGTRRAVPITLGDNYAGFPIVGTSKEFFDQRLKPTLPPYFRLAQGELFDKEHEAVLGAQVAQTMNLRLGDTFTGAHGLESHDEHEEEEHEEEEHEADGHDTPYTITGILKPTGGPVDRAVLTSVATTWEVHAHDEAATNEAVHDEHNEHDRHDDHGKEVTAVLYSAENLAGIYSTAGRINAGTQAMAVFPGQVFAQARGMLTQGQAAYAALSLLVLGIAALTVTLSVYSSSLERQRMVALLGTLGARRTTTFAFVLLETMITVTAGVLLGLLIAVLASAYGGQLLGAQLGFTLPAPQLTWALAGRALLLIPVGLLAALPAAMLTARVSPLKTLN